MAKYSKNQILDILKNLSDRLEKQNLSTKDVASVIPVSAITYRFGSLGNALVEAGLLRSNPGDNLRGKGVRLSDDDLFHALYEVEQRTGHEPGRNECNAKCRFSEKPYTKRFGKWPEVIAYYRKWKKESGTARSLSDAAAHSRQKTELAGQPDTSVAASEAPLRHLPSDKGKSPDQFYGEPINFRSLRNAPINEQGVVFLFGMVSKELGFNIESVQQGFPDCEGTFLYDSKKNLWAKARIEFEYRASAFQEHNHDPNLCDFIVCWVNDWPECPIQVIELRTEIMKLPSR